MSGLTQQRLKELLRYVKSTGKFYWRVAQGTAAAGDEAGSISLEGYIQITVHRQNHRAARLAWLYVEGAWPIAMIDHRNRCRTDNRWSNLREADNRQNQLNVGLKKTNTSGIPGVYWAERSQQWYAQIRVDGRNQHLGMFSDKLDAGAARKAAERQYYRL